MSEPYLLTSKSARILLFISFLVSSQFAITAYINSTFLTDIFGFSEVLMSFLFAAGALVSITELTFSGRFYARLGNRLSLGVSSFIALFSVVGLAFVQSSLLAGIFFVLFLAANSLLWYVLDLNLEHFASKEHTGALRGFLLSGNNLMWIIFSSAAASLINLESFSYFGIYFISAGLLALTCILSINFAPDFQILKKAEKPFLKKVSDFWHIDNLKNIFYINFVLQVAYVSLTIYLPVYLLNTIGFSWKTIAVIILIMLLPSVLFEYPAGKHIDKKRDSALIMKLGLFLLGGSLLFIPLITSEVWVTWAILLFIGRTGGSLIEVSSESYFYRHIQEKDLDFINIFRDAGPAALVVAPLSIGILLLAGVSLSFVFYMLGLLVLSVGIYHQSKLSSPQRGNNKNRL